MADPTLPDAGTRAPHRLWATVREALRGSRQDYTEGPIGRAIFLLAVPMILEMAMESIFVVVDVFFVARLGAGAVATVGLTESMLTLIYAVAIGLSIGATATVARRIGEKDPDAAGRAAVQVIVIGVLLSVVVGVVGIFAAPQLLAAMGAEPDVIEHGANFTRVMLGGNATIVLLFLINAIFRGAGDAAIAMRVLWLANGMNIALGPCLIFGLGPFPELGVTGAAVATNIGRGTGALVAFVRLTRGGSHIRVTRAHMRLEPATMLGVLRLSGTATFQVFIQMASWVGLVRILAAFGSAVVAGNTIAIRIIIFALLPSYGLANAAATMVGQSLGAGKPDRAERAVWMAGLYNFVFLGIVGAGFVVFAEPLIGAFTTDPAVVPYGVRCLRIVSCGFLFYAYGMVFTQAFNGAGDTWTPTYINLVCFWLWEIPLAYVLARTLGFGPTGVFIAIMVAFSTLAVLSAAVFRRGRWKLKKI